MKKAVEIYADLQNGKIDPVYLIAGAEDFIVESISKQILAKSVDEATKDFNLDILYGNEVDAGQIINIAMSYPMMAERRTVFVKNIHLLSANGLELLAKYVTRPSQTTCLILTASKMDFRKSAQSQIKNKSTFVEAKPLYDNQIPDWIRSHLKEQKLTISENAIQLLHASTGTSLRRIATEVEKIKLILGEKTNIEVEDIESVVGASREYNVFELCDAVGGKKVPKGLKILNGMLQLGEMPTGMLAMLNRHFSILAKLYEMKQNNARKEEIAKELRISPFFVDNYARQAGLYSRTQFSKAFELLLEADFQLKSSYQKPKFIMEMLLLKLEKI